MTSNSELENEPEVEVEGSLVDEVPEKDVLDASDSENIDVLRAEIEALKKTLSAAEQKAEENYELALRTKAEADNIKRRMENEVSNARKYGIEKFVQELLPVADSLELGLEALNDSGASIEKFREGSEMTKKMFFTAVRKFGVEVVDPVGEKFDPEFHQAMSMQQSADVEPNTVLNVFQKGYTLQGRLMRPAMVIVSQAVEAPPEKPSIDETV
ncbi:MAG TPA: nucleotide exchange factor GrpE [Gammaproteobacteria bacterium]|nr:nucleotide exchange factor GrpE [Gammaproteobacteria bacterium]